MHGARRWSGGARGTRRARSPACGSRDHRATAILRLPEDICNDWTDEKLYRALDATYLRPAANQEAAAERLGLPFSTYRRHLSTGVERVAAWLWERELHGA